MTLQQIAGLGRTLAAFLRLFADCFPRREGRDLLRVYVKGLLSSLHRKTAETIALEFGKPPRTLQRFLESIKWDEEKLRDRCEQIVAQEHAHPDAIGSVDESGITKSGNCTVGAGRQYNGSRGKVDNCTVGVHISYRKPGFQVLLDSQQYLPEDWANDPVRRKLVHVPDAITFQTKPQIALGLIDRALANGICVSAWNFDELYGRDGRFLDGLEDRKQAYVGEIPANFHGWLCKHKITRKQGSRRRRPASTRSSEVQNLVRYSVIFREKSWQNYRVKDTEKGPQVWAVKWVEFWRADEHGRPNPKPHCLIVARNVLTSEWKFFISNRVPGRDGVTIRWLLRVAFGRWAVESCFREAKEELGLDHYEVRGWQCVHRHFYLTQLSHLFCARVREKYDKSDADQPNELTIEQVRSATNTFLSTIGMARAERKERFEREIEKQRYHQKRNATARESHWKKRIKRFEAIGIDVDKIKSCVT